ncbi:MAG: hypothetical protein L0K29_10300 [Bifidobacterium crudilactis]|nr:hypothetical protein [Bifidobacterium crudilactis]MDN6458409.1 hypothetical protein [Bifidobacterium crudilactis]MDN6468228.1 hypothetical protein [Bifidobacterium crudilactis]MDN6654362.1 hypothetical protein [Bifidobacterium crudilactis]MDN6805466.1 hypothetical protein [Bifidobacterium crudilactis]
MGPYSLAITPRMTYGQIRQYADSLPVDICSARLPEKVQGIFNGMLGMIIVDRAMTYTQKRCTLTHELVHWSHGDDTCNGIMGARMERRTRRETASLLLNPMEYASAENVYEGDVALMAAELNVTIQVVKDYQELVLDV